MSESTKILFIGDIIGRPGRNAVKECLPRIVAEKSPDVVIANGENTAGGFGITEVLYGEVKNLGIDVITTGNHVWDRKEILEFLNTGVPDLIRPANYPEGTPGAGWTTFEAASGVTVGILNLSGRVFMDAIDCPFRVGREAVKRLREKTPVIVVDMHAETTSEKQAMGWFLDGTVSAVIGSHTHVQTADERILANGTAYITDAGMTGPTDSVIGMKKETIMETFISKLPSRFEVASKGIELQGVLVTINTSDGKATAIERIKHVM
jgi:metallophosphoesterase (TIGR00282 family)